MAYVNERISDADMHKYRIDETAWGYACNRFKDWVIDRERDIYLRTAYKERDNPSDEYWSFYWKGHEWPVYGYRLSYLPKTETQRSQKEMRFRFTKFPESLRPQIDQIRADFMEAYRAHTFYVNTDMTFNFE